MVRRMLPSASNVDASPTPGVPGPNATELIRGGRVLVSSGGVNQNSPVGSWVAAATVAEGEVTDCVCVRAPSAGMHTAAAPNRVIIRLSVLRKTYCIQSPLE